MEIEILQNRENKLVERVEVEFRVHHPGKPTPSRREVLEELAKKLGSDPELVVIRRISTPHGRTYSSCLAHVYKSKERMLSVEPRYILERGKKKEEGKGD